MERLDTSGDIRQGSIDSINMNDIEYVGQRKK